MFLAQTNTIPDAQTGVPERENERPDASGIVMAVGVAFRILIAGNEKAGELFFAKRLHPLGRCSNLGSGSV